MSIAYLDRNWMQPNSRSAAERGKAARAGREGAKRKRSGMRILVVEDEAVIALELESMLESLGHTVVAIAGSEREAVRLSQTKRPTIILMDVRLGRGGDGINAARAILQEMPVSIVFCSAYARDPGTRARMEEVHPSAILSKPILQAELKETLERLSAPRA
jgi:CheY-like chemotaxis protein